MIKYDSNLFYTCSLIEFISRKCHLKRSDTVNILGEKNISHIYNFADVLHCEVIDEVCDRFIEDSNIPNGDFDNISTCKYLVPDYWTIGQVYERLIEDVFEEVNAKNIMTIYNSWISDAISNYNSDFYYQPRDYIKECYLKKDVLYD